jgi:hypothetical protein
MSTIFLIIAVPWLYAMGYGHDAVRHGHCVVEPGSYKALFCPTPTWNANWRCRDHGECPK